MANRGLLVFLGLVAVSGLVACGGDDDGPAKPLAATTTTGTGGADGAGGAGTGGAGTTATLDPGEEHHGALPYAAGPYGIGKGSIIDNYKFYGFPNSLLNREDLKPIQLADFYNPHAHDPNYAPADAASDDRLFPPGSPHNVGDVQSPKPKVMLIDVSSSWCPPCQEEAKTVLPGRYAKYKPRGGEILLQLADGPEPGTAAEPYDLKSWTKKYKIDYPATIDPSYKLSALFDADAFPANLIIDTSTMKIVEVVAGEPDDKFWSKYEALLDP